MWGQKQSAMIAEAMILNFAVDNNQFTITEKINDVIREHSKGFSYIYFSEESIKDGYYNGQKYLNTLERKKIFHRIDTTIRGFHKFTRKTRSKDLSTLDNKEIFGFMKEYRHYLIFLQKLFRATDPSGTRSMEDEIKGILGKNYGTEETAKLLVTLTTPHEFDKTQEEIRDWYKLIKLKKRSDIIFKKHIFKYPGNFSNTLSYGEMISYLNRRLKKSKPEEIKTEIEKIRNAKEDTRKKQSEIYKQFADTDLQVFSETLQHIALVRFELKHAWSGSETLCLDLIKETAKRINIDFKEFFWAYNFTDIVDYFELGHTLSNQEIKERMEYSVVYYKNGKLLYKYGKNAKEYFQSVYRTGEKTSLKGQMASKGYATGKVKIIRVDDLAQFEKDLKTFCKGEIIITTMTSPIMVPLAEKAAAIVTNEGGICSHAAIIARELNIPCVVGTHDATKIFKNGDLIEVDANKGVVQILKRKVII